MNNWYCQHSGVTAGPLSLEEISFLASRGKLMPEDLVRRGEHGMWIPASQVEGLLVARPAEPTPQQTIASGVQEQVVEVPQTVITEPPEDPETGGRPSLAPPFKPSKESDRRQKLLIAWVVGAATLLLILLLLLAVWPRQEIAGQGKRDGTKSGRRAGAGSENPDSQEIQNNGKSGGQLTPGEGGKALEEQEEDRPKNESPVTLPEETPAEEQDENRDEPNDGGAPPKEETPSEFGGFTIQKFVPQNENNEDSILGGGRGGGPQAEMFKGRDPKNRAELAEKEGGTPESEAAVELGLAWLMKHQHDDGHWSLRQFMTVDDCQGQCTAPGMQSPTAATGLALMPLLGAGHTHGSGKYQRAVRKGLEWLVKDQTEKGNFKSIGSGNMYAHAQASIALCEAYAMTKDKALKEPAQRAIDYIGEAQHVGGGWRYGFQTAGDTSVMGWQILALKSAQSGGLRIPKGVFRNANKYLDTAQADKAGGRYTYVPMAPNRRRPAMAPNRRRPAMRLMGATPAMSAEGVLCRMYCGWHKDADGLSAGVDYIIENMPNQQAPNMYYWYYATQVTHHVGGDPWKRWNEAMRETLIDMQETKGHAAGSWTPIGGHSLSGGRIYMTSLALCTLEVYYRHAALFD